MKIDKIEIGWVNDDFIIDRLSAMAHVANDGGILPLKLYKDGNIKSFNGDTVNEDYIEKDITPDTLSALNECKNVIVFNGTFKDIPSNIPFSAFMESYVRIK